MRKSGFINLDLQIAVNDKKDCWAVKEGNKCKKLSHSLSVSNIKSKVSLFCGSPEKERTKVSRVSLFSLICLSTVSHVTTPISFYNDNCSANLTHPEKNQSKYLIFLKQTNTHFFGGYITFKIFSQY